MSAIFGLRLVPVFWATPSPIDPAISTFSLSLDHQHSNSNLNHPSHNHVSISHVKFLSPGQLHHSRLNKLHKKLKIQ
jgi:hypothetical protein